ncbi:MAG: hypothetical protein JSS40_17600 [Proteobacteria bacterium]|nr:hypothetical protein [Pseudomonadota bacterium]
MRIAAGVLAASAALAFGALAAEPAGHHHEAAGLSTLKLNGGQKWATDAPLRKGMEDIRNAIADRKDAIHAGKLTPAKYAALADRIDAQVAYMVQNCKLAPEADAQLHAVIGEMMEGTEAARGKVRKVDRHAGVDKVVAALEAYNKHFDHPGWRGLE